MIWFLLTVIVWLLVGRLLYWRCVVSFYEKKPYLYNQRHHGLISFTDSQTLLLYELWPLTIILTALYVLFCWSIGGLAWIQKTIRKRRS